MSQIKAFTSVTHQYVNNVFAITVKITFLIPCHGFIVYFRFKRSARLETFTSVINRIVAKKKNPTSLTRGGGGFYSNFAFVRIFGKFLGCLVASCAVLCWKHCFNSLLLMFSRLRASLFKLLTWLELNVLVKIIFSKSLFLSNFGWKHLVNVWSIISGGQFLSIRCFLSSLNLFSLLSVTMFMIRLAKESAILFLVWLGWQLLYVK